MYLYIERRKKEMKEPTITEMYRDLLEIYKPSWIIGLSDTEIRHAWYEEIGYYR